MDDMSMQPEHVQNRQMHPEQSKDPAPRAGAAPAPYRANVKPDPKVQGKRMPAQKATATRAAAQQARAAGHPSTRPVTQASKRPAAQAGSHPTQGAAAQKRSAMSGAAAPKRPTAQPGAAAKRAVAKPGAVPSAKRSAIPRQAPEDTSTISQHGNAGAEQRAASSHAAAPNAAPHRRPSGQHPGAAAPAAPQRAGKQASSAGAAPKPSSRQPSRQAPQQRSAARRTTPTRMAPERYQAKSQKPHTRPAEGGMGSVRPPHAQAVGSGGNGGGKVPFAAAAVAVVVIAALIGVGAWWMLWRSVDVSVNGEVKSVQVNTAAADYLKELDYCGVKPGRLLSVSGKVLEDTGGTPCTLMIDGEEVSLEDAASRELEGGEELSVTNGTDTTEEHTEETVEIKPGIQKEESGAIQFVSQWGKAGEKVVWKGKVSGEEVDHEVTTEPVDMVVSSLTPNPSGGKYMALTFDDGPSEYTSDILDILSEKGVTATFFNLGTQASNYPSLAERVVSEGHEMASHTNEHMYLPNCTRKELRHEISSAFDSIEDASGASTQMIRAPYGAFTDVEWARSADLITCNVLWNIDTLDWERPGADAIKDAVLDYAFNGAIVLMHDGGGNREQDVEALPGIIDGLREQGYELVTVSKLMELDGRFPDDVVNGKVEMPEDAVLPDA